MVQPQIGVFALGTPENTYVEIDLIQGGSFRSLVDALTNLPGFRTENGVNVVLGFRPGLWRELEPAQTPMDAADWTEPINGSDGFSMPATPHDAWVWISGQDRATVFDNILAVRNAIYGIAEVVTETDGWHYKEGRDLTGFIDGTENPTILEAPQIATVPVGSPGAGSTVLVFQVWPHDVPAWTGLPVEHQENVIGRSKRDSIEMSPETIPQTSHVARTKITVDGVEHKIFRHNVAYGVTGEHGTVFVGFSQDQWRQFEMLRRMAGVDGIRDELTRFSHPISGATYVIPSATVLGNYVRAGE